MGTKIFSHGDLYKNHNEDWRFTDEDAFMDQLVWPQGLVDEYPYGVGPNKAFADFINKTHNQFLLLENAERIACQLEDSIAEGGANDCTTKLAFNALENGARLMDVPFVETAMEGLATPDEVDAAVRAMSNFGSSAGSFIAGIPSAIWSGIVGFKDLVKETSYRAQSAWNIAKAFQEKMATNIGEFIVTASEFHKRNLTRSGRLEEEAKALLARVQDDAIDAPNKPRVMVRSKTAFYLSNKSPSSNLETINRQIESSVLEKGVEKVLAEQIKILSTSTVKDIAGVNDLLESIGNDPVSMLLKGLEANGFEQITDHERAGKNSVVLQSKDAIGGKQPLIIVLSLGNNKQMVSTADILFPSEDNLGEGKKTVELTTLVKEEQIKTLEAIITLCQSVRAKDKDVDETYKSFKRLIKEALDLHKELYKIPAANRQSADYKKAEYYINGTLNASWLLLAPIDVIDDKALDIASLAMDYVKASFKVSKKGFFG